MPHPDPQLPAWSSRVGALRDVTSVYGPQSEVVRVVSGFRDLFAAD